MFSRSKRKNVLVLGSAGMLGKELVEFLRADAADHDGTIGIVTGLDYPAIDITSIDSLNVLFHDSIHYDYVINCAAITDTKGIEDCLKVKSYEVNALACQHLAKVCKAYKSKLVHISTDYVFSENSGSSPFSVDALPVPVNTYGVHKLLGEQFIRLEMDQCQYAIIRVSWLYGKHNAKSFVHKFLKNCASKIANDTFDIPCTEDEFSTPTSCKALSMRILKVISYGLSGIFHGNDYSSAGKVSRLEFCDAILANLKALYPTSKTINALKCVGVATVPSGMMRYPLQSAMTPSDFSKNSSESPSDNDHSWKINLDSLMLYDPDMIHWTETVFGTISRPETTSI